MSVTLAGVGLAHGNGTRALAAIDLAIGAGERVAVIGPSGAGKTTLLRLLATALRPSEGQLAVLGDDPWRLSPRARKALRARIGLIHQAPPLPPRQRVVTAVGGGRLGRWSLARGLANLLYPLDINGVGETLARLDLADRLFDRCDQLSGGQLQRVGIARVLYQEAELLLADEPVSAMDPTLADHSLAVLAHEAQSRGVTLVASLHAVDLALKHFPRIVGLRDGRILFDRAPGAIPAAALAALYANEQLRAPAPDSEGARPLVLPIPRC